MEKFFKSFRFRILAMLFVAVFFFMVHAAQNRQAAPLISSVIGSVLTPVKKVSASVYYGVINAFSDLFSASDTAKENELLKEEAALYRQMLVELERYKSENEHLREFLEIKRENPGFSVEPAMVIARETSDRFYSFTIDCGAKSGVKAGNPVITRDGLVGIVSETGANHAKVRTILDAAVEVGVMDVSTREVGVTSGSVTLAEQGLLRMAYLPRDALAKKGHLVATAGIGGMYPKELIVGEIVEISPDSNGLSLNAVIRPFGEIQTIQSVLVIKSFEE